MRSRYSGPEPDLAAWPAIFQETGVTGRTSGHPGAVARYDREHTLSHTHSTSSHQVFKFLPTFKRDARLPDRRGWQEHPHEPLPRASC